MDEGLNALSYVEEMPWWPIQSTNTGRKKNAKDYEEIKIGLS